VGRDYTVVGMTCGHCVAAVREELERLAGVVAVEVDLESGRVRIQGDASGEDVAGAVAEAGYAVAPEAPA
jgi:copper chaperone CopZ